MEHGLGRRPSPPDARDYPVCRFGQQVGEMRYRMRRIGRGKPDIEWVSEVVLDQGKTPHCVGFSFAGFGNVLPVDSRMTDEDGHRIYRSAKIIDGTPESVEGATIRSGAKAYRNIGRINAYAFSKDLDEIKAWVQTFGSVVVGTLWKEAMNYPDYNTGLVQCKGEIVGGHAYLLTGYSVSTDTFTVLNSWGAGWGKRGRFRCKVKEWWDLFREDDDGEALMAIELPIEHWEEE